MNAIQNGKSGRFEPVHGHCTGTYISATWNAWHAMIGRCEYPSHRLWKRYGGRGITVCDAWRKSFIAFLKDMGDNPKGMSLDRIDNNSGYFKDNCRWATRSQQQRNKTNSVMVSINGVTKNRQDWCDEFSVNYMTYNYRVSIGMTPLQALTKRKGIFFRTMLLEAN